jgi:Flp pilus assembly protein TadG
VIRLARYLRRFGADRRGVAAVEMSLVTSAFAVAMFNAVEVGRYAYILMEAEQATQAGAQAAYVTCDSQHVPATQNCPGLNAAVTTAVQSTTLGTHVTLNGAIDEAYYCVDSTGALVYASDLASKPSDCSAYGSTGLAPVLYLQVHTTYTYAPIFTGFTIAGNFPTTVQKTAWMRML